MIIIYDDNGSIIMTQTGGDDLVENGINIMKADIPDGYGVGSINVETGEPVLYEIEKSLQERQIAAIYNKLSEGYAGSADSPIPWVYGMECKEGFYYSYNGKAYKIAVGGYMNPCVWYPDSGIWQFEVIE